MTDNKPNTMIEDAFKKALQPTPRRGAGKPCDQDALIDAIAGAVDPANFYMRAGHYGNVAGSKETAAAVNDIARNKARAALAAIATAGYEIRPPDKPCDPADPCSSAYDLASECNTFDGLLRETKDRLDAAMAQVTRLREALRRTATDIRAQTKASELYARDERHWPGFPSATEISIGNFREIADRAERAALAETADPETTDAQ